MKFSTKSSSRGRGLTNVVGVTVNNRQGVRYYRPPNVVMVGAVDATILVDLDGSTLTDLDNILLSEHA